MGMLGYALMMRGTTGGAPTLLSLYGTMFGNLYGDLFGAI